MSDFPRVLSQVLARVPQGIRLGVERTRAAAERVGRPDRSFPVLHVAGTNGKGSVSAQCEAVLRRAGYRTGLFTSPHLCRFAERIRIDGEPLDDATLAEVLAIALALDDGLSFFETAFIASMLAFQRAAVDVVVLEVGLGGRLDATNIVERPLVTSITRVALDHVKQLGTTLASIASEKAAIAKPGVPMVLGVLEPEAEAVARREALQRGASAIYQAGKELTLELDAAGGTLLVPGRREPLRLQPRLRGAHQVQNAAVAAAMCSVAAAHLTAVTTEHIERGIEQAQWPGRLESLSDGRGEVLIDAAHNPDGVQSLAAFLRAEGSSWRGAESTALVFGAMDDKAWPEMLGMLGELASHRFYVEPPGRKAAPVSALRATLPGVGSAELESAVKGARAAVGDTGLVVVAGSIFLAGRVRAMLLGLPTDPAVAL